MKKAFQVVLISLIIAGLLGCSASRKTKGAAVGATAGGVAGAVIGKQAGNTLLGAIIGAAVGGAAGAYIGNYMDNQAEEIEQDLEGATVERIGEGIKITFNSGLLFDVDKANLRPASQEELAKLANILNKYEETNILIEGHTDATGSDDYNLELSRRRSQSVANYLASLNVSASRFTIMGYGESQPIASNETVDGRQLNRRVDIAVMANDKLKKVAEQKTG
ncbi:MAG: OmpA family protein [Calditrichaeota bacterium]|nr:OmpA family protein [Calditrichota bacterium]RQV92505.1 MAG: OmpA family protein [bacterium]RQV99361.1 MAG: OmpA family protein [Calditrichota bacterium]